MLIAKCDAAYAFSNKRCPPIIIYTMGKVGSSTVYKSLSRASLPNPILFLHFLSDDLPIYKQAHRNAGIYPFPDHLYLSEATRRQLKKHKNFPLKVISLVRDPVAITISNLFQNPQFAEQSVLDGMGAIDLQKAGAYLNRELICQHSFPYIYEWFNKELKAVFGIDVFAEPFPLDKGFAIYSADNIEVLVIRLEDLSGNGPQALADFLGLPAPLILKGSNIRAGTNEKTIYQKLMENVSLDPAACKAIYSSDFVRHFYSEALINVFIAQWTKVDHGATSDT